MDEFKNFMIEDYLLISDANNIYVIKTTHLLMHHQKRIGDYDLAWIDIQFGKVPDTIIEDELSVDIPLED